MNTKLLLNFRSLELILPLLILAFVNNALLLFLLLLLLSGSGLDILLRLSARFAVHVLRAARARLLTRFFRVAYLLICRPLRSFTGVLWFFLYSRVRPQGVHFALNHREITQVGAQFALKFVLFYGFPVRDVLNLFLHAFFRILNFFVYQIFLYFVLEFLP